ncbi:hypothetical protein Tco_0963593 [Tanacetum coccineum]
MLEGSSKRAGTELEQEVTKKQKVDDVQETAKVDNDQEAAKIKELMEIVHDKDEVEIDAIPLATKPPTIGRFRNSMEIGKSLSIGSTSQRRAMRDVLWGDLKRTDIQKESQKRPNQARDGKDKVNPKPKSVKVKSQPHEENTT